MSESNNNQDKPFPLIPEALLVELNNRFPEMCADLEWTERQVWYVSGQRSVVRFLNLLFHEQRENSLGGK